jgi:Protein of unknown function (DUF3347)
MNRYLTRLLLVGCMVAPLLGLTARAASEPLKAIIASYLQIHAKLVTDKIDGIKAPAEAIQKQAAALGAGGAPIAKAAAAIAASSDLKTAREAFGGLSDAVIAAARAAGPATMQELRAKIAFCPMVNRSWVQTDEKLRNPYYGSSMLECGEFKK